MYDRYWRLRVAGAMVCIAAALAFAAWYAVYVLPIDLRAGKLAFTGILAAVDVAFVLLGIAAYQLLAAVPARRRQRLREEAMAGNQDAIPLARPLMSSTNGAGEADESFEVKLASAVFRWLIVVFLFAFLVGITWLVVGGELQEVDFIKLRGALMCPYGQEPNCAAIVAALMLAYLLVVPGYTLMCVYFIIEILRPFSNFPIRIDVRTEGLVVHIMMRRSRSIPWSDIRLIEVQYPSSQQRVGRGRLREFMCFTHAFQFGWGLAVGGAASLPVARLMSVTLARTGLLERTFDPVLVAADVTSPRQRFSRSERVSARFPTILIGVALSVAMVAFFPVLLPRDRPGAEVALGVTITWLVWYLVLSIRAPKLTAREQGGVALVSAASFDDSNLVISPAATYEMTVGSYPLFKANQVAFAFLGLLVMLAGGVGILNEFNRSLLTYNGAPLIPISLASNSILIGLIALGLVIVILAVRARDTVVLAEIDGVRKRWLLGNMFIPWERVDRIERARYWGAPGYRVVSSAPKTVIQWPSQPFQPSRKPQEPSAILTTPDQMAQIVSQRSGKAIQVMGNVHRQ